MPIQPDAEQYDIKGGNARKQLAELRSAVLRPQLCQDCMQFGAAKRDLIYQQLFNQPVVAPRITDRHTAWSSAKSRQHCRLGSAAARWVLT